MRDRRSVRERIDLVLKHQTELQDSQVRDAVDRMVEGLETATDEDVPALFNVPVDSNEVTVFFSPDDNTRTGHFISPYLLGVTSGRATKPVAAATITHAAQSKKTARSARPHTDHTCSLAEPANHHSVGAQSMNLIPNAVVGVLPEPDGRAEVDHDFVLPRAVQVG